MQRRTFISLLGGAAGWPLRVQAQKPTAVIGYLAAGLSGPLATQVGPFYQALSEAGYVPFLKPLPTPTRLAVSSRVDSENGIRLHLVHD